MAGGTSAHPVNESAWRGTGRARRFGASIWVRFQDLGPGRYLIVAAALHFIALILSLAARDLGRETAFIAIGLALVLLALRLPQNTSPASGNSKAEPAPPPLTSAAMVTSFERTDVGLPAALPFMGERILLKSDHPSIARLAHAAARLSPISAARTYPWGELMARVSHELRTPLNAVIGFSDVMNAELLGPVGHPRYREYARHIRDCGRELLKSAEDTLAITCLLDAQGSSLVAPPLDLASLVADAWNFYGEEVCSRGLSLEIEMPEGVELLIERRPMRQILINLFAEAIRRADDGGVIGLTACKNADLVQIEVFVRGRQNSASVGEASLAICLARALLEMQGAALIEVDDPFSTWRALTVLRCAAQQDFFGLSFDACERPARLC